jgi:hypothetical protein
MGLSAMLDENDKPTLSRFQMFAWTWISIYLLTVVSEVPKYYGQVQNLVLPTIDPTLVVLMGLSQVAFLGGKSTVPLSATDNDKQSPPAALGKADIVSCNIYPDIVCITINILVLPVQS